VRDYQQGLVTGSKASGWSVEMKKFREVDRGQVVKGFIYKE
jgi:hypothetical protein